MKKCLAIVIYFLYEVCVYLKGMNKALAYLKVWKEDKASWKFEKEIMHLPASFRVDLIYIKS